MYLYTWPRWNAGHNTVMDLIFDFASQMGMEKMLYYVEGGGVDQIFQF